MGPPTAVFDAMTYLQAVASEGPAAACLRLVEAGRVRLVSSAAILREVENILGRPKVRAKNPRLTDAVVTKFLDKVTALAPPAVVVPASFRYPRDPKDEPYLNLAVAAQAGFVVSWDNDLLDLMKPTNPDGVAFLSLVPGLRVVTPPEFLAVLRGMAKREEEAEEGTGPA